MKVLIWVGNPTRVYGWEHKKDLARVWVDERRKVHVQALAPEFAEFARITQEEIDRRLADPNEHIFHRTGNSWETKDGTVKSVTRLVDSVPGKDDFLDVLRSDVKLTDGDMGRDIAGYEIDTGASRIVEE